MARFGVLLALAALILCAPAQAAGAGGREPTPQPRLTMVPGGSVTVPDPEGGRSWTARAARTSSGTRCVLVSGGATRRPLRACGRLTERSPYLLGTRSGAERTVVYGIAGPQVAKVELLGIHARAVRMSRRGRAFIAVIAGTLSPTDLPIRVTERGGKVTGFDWSRSTLETLDPVSGERWRLQTTGRSSGPRGGQTCAQFLPHDGSVTGRHNLAGDVACADLAAVPFGVKILDYAGRNGPPGSPVTTRRTVVVGVAGETVAQVELVTPAGRRRLDLTTERRGFLAVLDPATPASAVQVVVTFADGTTQTVDRTTGVATLPG